MNFGYVGAKQPREEVAPPRVVFACPSSWVQSRGGADPILTSLSVSVAHLPFSSEHTALFQFK